MQLAVKQRGNVSDTFTSAMWSPPESLGVENHEAEADPLAVRGVTRPTFTASTSASGPLKKLSEDAGRSSYISRASGMLFVETYLAAAAINDRVLRAPDV